jgi:hypothetical protein
MSIETLSFQLKRMKTPILTVLLLIFFSISAVAQKEVRGTVVDTLGQFPIESASIYVKNTTIGTISNMDGKFSLNVPQENLQDTLVISSIGYKSFKSTVEAFENGTTIYLFEDIASLDEVLIVADKRPKTGNEIVLRAIEELPETMPDSAYIQRAFLRHRERNKKEYKWLIESALSVYDAGYGSDSRDSLLINVDEVRKSYDLREVDSLFAYTAYLKSRNPRFKTLQNRNLNRDTIATSTLVKAIKWNDERVNGLANLFQGKLNLVRNAGNPGALFTDKMLEEHQFRLDTVLVENDEKLYKIEISKGADFVGLNTPGIYNEGFEPKGWIYIYWDDFAIKKIEYNLVAASDVQKRRSKSLLGTLENHKLVLDYRRYNEKMYLNYINYETPKLVKVGDRSTDAQLEENAQDPDEQFYYTIQEILFTEIIEDPGKIEAELQNKEWNADVFSPKPYHPSFWRNYNVLLESEEEEKLIQDLSRRATLFQE